MPTDQPVRAARPIRARRPRPLFEFPHAEPVFVGSSWRAAAVRWTGAGLVAVVVVVLGLLVSGLTERSVPAPGTDPSTAAVATDVR